MKKLIIFVQHMTDGGAERVLSELVTEWCKKDLKITIVEIEPGMFENSYTLPADVEIVKYQETTARIVKHIRTILSMIKTMRQNKDATVLAFNKIVIYKLALAMLFTKNRIVLSERNDPYTTPFTRSRRWLRDLAFQHADACVFQTPDARDYFCEKVRKKGVIIPNPINPELPSPYTGERDKTIIAAGRLDPQKNFSMLIKAFAMLHNEFPAYRLIIYGRGPLEQPLRELSIRLGVNDHVELPGFADDLYEKMRTCSVYVSSSDYEGISNSMLEALAMGIPSVVTDCPIGGAKMVIENNRNGILVPTGDEAAMYEGIKRILSDPAFAVFLGNNAYLIRKKYPIREIAEQWLGIF